MLSRRRLLGGMAGGSVVSLAGCALFDDEIEASARPARVSESVRSEAGYQHHRTESQRFEQTVTVADQERRLVLTNWTTEYRKLPGGQESSAATFLVFTTPTITVAGRSANPFERFDERRLIDEMEGRSEEGTHSGDLEEVGDRSMTVLGQRVELSQYESTQDISDQSVTIRSHIGTLTHDGDLLVIFGSHPDTSEHEQLADEAENISRLAEGIDHPTEA